MKNLNLKMAIANEMVLVNIKKELDIFKRMTPAEKEAFDKAEDAKTDAFLCQYFKVSSFGF